MKLPRLLKLQLLYYLAGMIFNTISFLLINKAGTPLTPNDPIMGCIAMTIYALFLIPGFLHKIKIYRFLMIVAVFLLGYGGVINHFNMINESPELYHSVTAGVIGVMINIFGLTLNILAAIGKFK